MSSQYDNVQIGEEIFLPQWNSDTNPNEAGFQSKTLPDAFCLREVVIKPDGLFVEEFETENVPLEERPAIKEKEYDNPEKEANPLEKLFGSINKTKSELKDISFHGDFYFYTSHNDEWYEYKARYTHGKLEDIKRVQKGDRL